MSLEQLVKDTESLKSQHGNPLPNFAGSWHCQNASVSVKSNDQYGSVDTAKYTNSLGCSGTALTISVTDDIDGQPYSAQATLSLDIDSNEYHENWSDSFGFAYNSKGHFDPAKNVISFEGDLIADGNTHSMLSEYEIISDNQYRYRLTNLTENLVLKDVVFTKV